MISNRIAEAISTAKNYPYIVRVGVFGSHARNEETAFSDIDILIDYDNSSEEYLDDIDGFMEDMERLIPDKIDYVTMRGLMRCKDELFRQNVLSDVNWVYSAERGGV